MQQMLRLVDKGVRLATEAKLDDIKLYCFEVIDMCYLQMDFETCESDYPDLCSAYNEYVAEKKKKRKGVPRNNAILMLYLGTSQRLIMVVIINSSITLPVLYGKML